MASIMRENDCLYFLYPPLSLFLNTSYYLLMMSEQKHDNKPLDLFLSSPDLTTLFLYWFAQFYYIGGEKLWSFHLKLWKTNPSKEKWFVPENMIYFILLKMYPSLIQYNLTTVSPPSTPPGYPHLFSLLDLPLSISI